MSRLAFGAGARTLQVAALAAILVSCVSCAHSGAVRPTEAAAQELIGWHIQVTTTDGRILEFQLLDVTEDALIGRSEHVRFDDVASLEWQDTTITRSPWFWVGVGATSVLLAIVWFLIELDRSI